ncbi:UNVERIFIED_CONTAM: hypothetical protein GTU68_052590, partial [Idotea baltica]|nr:hypothetical protein [Idotea baltica]
MYYSSEGSDSENGQDSCSLDFSYLLLDSESFGLHLKNSIQERVDKIKSKKETPPSLKNSKLDLNLLQLDSSEVSVRKRSRTKRPNLESDLEEIQKDSITDKLLMHHNLLLTLPFEVTLFPNIRFLDLSNNNLSHINDFLLTLVHLQTLYIKNNELQDGSLPKDLSPLTKLRELNLSGNKFTRFPPQLYDVASLKYLYLGSNDIIEVLPDVKNQAY